MKSNISLFEAIAYINIAYSIVEAVAVSSKVYDENEYYMWKCVYIGNFFVNVLLCIRSFVYGKRFPIIIWFAYTVPLFVLRLIYTPYKRIDRIFVIISCFIDAYIFITFFIMAAAYKKYSVADPEETASTVPAPAQIGWNASRGVRLSNAPSSTRYEPSQSLYETHIPSVPLFIGDSNIACTDMSPLNNYQASNDKDNCCADDGGKCDSGGDIGASDSGGGGGGGDCSCDSGGGGGDSGGGGGGDSGGGGDCGGGSND